MDEDPHPELISLADFERAASTRLSSRAHAYIAGGAGGEVSLADNCAAWDRIALRPRVLTGVAEPDLSVELLGRRLPHPVLIAPTAFAALTHAEAEVGIARAAAATGTTFCLSTLGSTSPAALAEQVPGVRRWMQLYVFSDRGVTRELIAEAEARGYEALVVTADRPVLGLRERELRVGVRGDAAEPVIAQTRTAGAVVSAAAGAMVSGAAGGGLGGAVPVDFSARIDPTLTWRDISALTAETGLPLIVKGVLTAEDAHLAAEHGAAGVVVSNHGGRQLDTTLAGADALPEIAESVGDRIAVLVDGGIRRGGDVVKALALGAHAVMVGRPPLWGLALDGAAGAERVLETLLGELRTTLTLCGAPAAAHLDRSLVTRAPWAGGG